MTRKAPNYIWRKRAAVDWAQRHEPQLHRLTKGKHAVIERPGRARIELELFCRTVGVARELVKTLGGSVTRLPVDWEARAFKAHQRKPLQVGRRLTIRSDADITDDPSVLLIPAGAAFGTGEHATTAMSLRMLEQISRGRPPGWRMLDAGTGSGILALAGRRFGAAKVLAVDNDRLAIRTARENERCNGIRNVKFIVGDIHQTTADRFDIITANLYSELLAAVLPRFRRCLRPDGRLILSGILRTQEPPLRRALRANRFRVMEARRRGKWVALLCSSGL